MSQFEREDLAHRFKHHPPKDQSVTVLHETIRNSLLVRAVHISDSIPDCRERALAITKLEECMFWANAAIARNISSGRKTVKIKDRNQMAIFCHLQNALVNILSITENLIDPKDNRCQNARYHLTEAEKYTNDGNVNNE